MVPTKRTVSVYQKHLLFLAILQISLPSDVYLPIRAAKKGKKRGLSPF